MERPEELSENTERACLLSVAEEEIRFPRPSSIEAPSRLVDVGCLVGHRDPFGLKGTWATSPMPNGQHIAAKVTYQVKASLEGIPKPCQCVIRQ